MKGKSNNNTPTIKDVARIANVSLKTVSRVINESSNVKAETRQIVSKVINDIGYRPNSVAKSLRIKKTFSIGVIIADITNSFHSVLVRGIEDVALSKNYSILLANSDEKMKKEKMYVNVFMEKQIDGLIVVPSAGSQEYMIPFSKQLPIVFLDRKANDINTSLVESDNFQGAYKITQHLIGHGYSRIAYIGHDGNFSTGKERFRAYKAALSNANITLQEEYVKVGNRTIEDAFNATQDILKNKVRPQAIFASNNVIAFGVMKALVTNNLNIPRDVAFVAFDDFLFSEIFKPHLTVVSQPAYEMGKIAAEILLEQIEKGLQNTHITLPVEIVFRESCGCTK